MYKLGKIIRRSPLIVFMILISMISIIPFYFIISMSTHTTSEIYRGELFTLGTAFADNMRTIFEGRFHVFYKNSFITSVASGILCVIVSALAGYGLYIYNFKAKKMMTSFIIATMMIPAQISLIGYTVEMRNLGLTNSLLPLILTWGASAYGVFFMLQYMKTSIAMELIESARIDGCGELRTFFSIALPLIKAASGTFFMLIFLWSWNNFLMPSTIITNREKFTIPIGIQTLATAYTQDWGARGAALTISVVPLLIFFAIGSKYFIKGLVAGAVKG